MKLTKALAATVFVGLVMLAPTVAVAQAGGAVMQVVAVEAKGDASSYLALVKKAMPIMTKHGATNVRVLRATVAGPNSGTIFVSVEYASAEAWGKSGAALQADPEWQKLLKEFEATGRTVVSNSILTDVTPK